MTERSWDLLTRLKYKCQTKGGRQRKCDVQLCGKFSLAFSFKPLTAYLFLTSFLAQIRSHYDRIMVFESFELHLKDWLTNKATTFRQPNYRHYEKIITAPYGNSKHILTNYHVMDDWFIKKSIYKITLKVFSKYCFNLYFILKQRKILYKN